MKFVIKGSLKILHLPSRSKSDPVSQEQESSSVLRRSCAIGDTRPARFLLDPLLCPLPLRTRTETFVVRPTDLRSSRYVNTWNEKAPHLGRPTAVHRIVFCRHLSSRSGITLPRWYTMTFILGFVRVAVALLPQLYSVWTCLSSGLPARPFRIT